MIELPRYGFEPKPLGRRSDRIRAIVTVGLSQRFRKAGNDIVIAIGFLSTILPLILVFAFSGPLLGPGGIGLNAYFFPYGSPLLLLFIALIASLVGAGIIADDRSTMALSLYLSRPITTRDYLLAKVAIVATFIALIALLPGFLGALVTYLLGYAPIDLAARAMASFVLLGALITATFTGLALLLSGLSSRRMFAGAGIFGFTLGLEAIANGLAIATGERSVLHLSLWQNLLSVGRALFQVDATGSIDPLASAAILVAFSASAFLLTYTRLARLEVITE